jgi:branched-chain amino acid transport system permease protein
LIDLALDIATTAGILFVVASGLLVIYGVLRVINFAHGAFLTAGAYVPVVAGWAGVSPWLAAPAAAGFGALVGLAIERVVVRPLYRRPLDAILATWGLGLVVGQLLTLGFGREVQFAPAPLSGTAHFGGTEYSVWRLVLAAVAVAIGVGFTLLLDRTRLGLTARAVIMNEPLARALGINTRAVRAVTFALGGGLAAAAGALLTPLSSVDPNMGVPYLINAFMLVMVSGASFGALAVACLVFGGLQVLVSTYVSTVFGGLVIALTAALLLRVRPTGFVRG